MIVTIDKNGVMLATNYTKTQAQNLIRLAKKSMVNDGFDWYSNKRIGRVPIQAVEGILGVKIHDENGIIKPVQIDTASKKENSHGSK